MAEPEIKAEEAAKVSLQVRAGGGRPGAGNGLAVPAVAIDGFSQYLLQV